MIAKRLIFFSQIALIGLIAFSVEAKQSLFTLESQKVKVTIEPSTLSIQWNNTSLNKPTLTVNGVKQRASQINSTRNTLTWTLLPSGLGVTATLTDKLLLSFSAQNIQGIAREEPLSLTWYRLNSNKAQELYLPFSEGMRIPIDNLNWVNYLEKNYSGTNTTQDLKMPFWTAKQNRRYFSWHLINPTNNLLHFSSDVNKLQMTASHQFTELSQQQPFVVSIQQNSDWLGGAKAYRQWRIDNGYSITLLEKAKHNPDVKKMIGASQVYLFGNAGISIHDVKDWQGLNVWALKQSIFTVTKDLKQALLSANRKKSYLSKYHQHSLINTINQYLSSTFKVPNPTITDNSIEKQFQATQKKKQWISEHLGLYLIEPTKWGQALSQDVLDSLYQSGLKRLWLGFDNWLPAFFQPQVIKDAKRLGYLIATYDSYNTAIPPSHNDDWLTAQLPLMMMESCTVENADKQKQTGFRGNGFYLNPNCQLEYVLERVKDILRFGHFNSLFLDVDGTAMAREDYHSSQNEQMLLNGFNNRMENIIESTGIILGSEDGNALTTKGIVFAHGLESIGFGWQDYDMTKNKRSLFYLGAWYPDYGPAFFFKPARVKEPYKTLLFAPQFRIPLYQTVFHDEVINSHHWHSDSLKFSDVKTNRDLTMMLFNTPAMVHLNRENGQSPSSRRIKELVHYQSAFKPIHQQLWNKQLTGFTWLDESGQVQRTSFSDGSQITANFSNTAFKLESSVIKAHSIYAEIKGISPFTWGPM